MGAVPLSVLQSLMAPPQAGSGWMAPPAMAPASAPAPAPQPPQQQVSAPPQALMPPPQQQAAFNPPPMHPVQNLILSLLDRSGRLAQSVRESQMAPYQAAQLRMAYDATPDRLKPYFRANPQGFLTEYEKNFGQKLGSGDMLPFAGADGGPIYNHPVGIDEKSGKPYSLNQDGTVNAGQSLGGDIKTDDRGVAYSSRNGDIPFVEQIPIKDAFGNTTFRSGQILAGPGAPGASQAAVSMPPVLPGPNGGPAVSTASAGRSAIKSMIASRAAAAGVDPAAMLTFAGIESSMNPKARNGSSTGLYQFHPDTFTRVGGDPAHYTDPQAQTDAAIALYKQNHGILSQSLGRAPSDAELYLAHQQSPQVAAALITAPQGQGAVQTLINAGVSPAVATRSITGNGGTANMTAQDFVGKWDQTYARKAQQWGTWGDEASMRNVTPGAEQAPAIQSAGQPASAQAGPQVLMPATGEGGGGGGFVDQKAIQGLTGPALLAALPPSIATQVKAMTEGRLAFPTRGGLTSPIMQQLIGLAGQYEPGFDATVYQQRLQAQKSISSGGPVANNIVALSTALQHVGQLYKLVDDLHNGPMPFFNGIGNWASAQAGQPNVGNFEFVRDRALGEVERVFRGTGGSQSEIDTAAKKLSAAGSPDQLRGAIKEVGGMLQARMDEALRPYNMVMPAQLDPRNLMSPQARDVADMLDSGKSWTDWHQANGTYRGTGGQATAPQAPAASAPVRLDPKSPDAAYHALQPGALYIGPDGQVRRK